MRRINVARPFEWAQCVDCPALQYVRIYPSKSPKDYRCLACRERHRESQKKKPGDRVLTRDGYIYLYLDPADPLFAASVGGVMPEHRYVMAKSLGRPLEKGETVHHKNRVRHDNRLENLELWQGAQPYGARTEDLVLDYLNRLCLSDLKILLSKTTHAANANFAV